VFSLIQRHGSITYQKVDDMIMQQEVVHNRKATIAVVTDSACDLPSELLEKHQIHVLPLSIHFGESFFLDRLTMQPQQFYNMLEHTDTRPTTSQPTGQDFVNKYEYLSSLYKSVIGIHISHNLSGTFQNSQRSAREVSERTGRPIHVFSSRNLSGALGLLVLRIAREVESGVKTEELLPRIDEWIGKTHLRVSIPTLNYIIKSGRVSPFKSFVARTLDLKPVISLDKEGKVVLSDKSFTHAGSRNKVMKSIRKTLKNGEIWEYAITHADNQETADWFTREMEMLTGKKPAFSEHVSPALVANTGPGVTGVSFILI
jgi:DegV family protein with EDD domain